MRADLVDVRVGCKRTRQFSRSNSACSSEDESNMSTTKRRRFDSRSSSPNFDLLTPNYKLKDPARIYNFDTNKKPAELFRKDLISAMKMADSEHLNEGEYITIVDHWKEDWEKGVQVPVNPKALPAASFRLMNNKSNSTTTMTNNNNKMTLTNKTIKKELNESHSNNKRHSNSSPGKSTSPSKSSPKSLSQATSSKLSDYIEYKRHPSELQTRYELDIIDLTWHKLISETNLPAISEELIEDVITELERQCAENMKSNKIGIEFNDGVVCDVCRSPYSEDGNEMVFCDTCDVCVHQACYDIDEIPEGEWYCQPCKELGKVDKASCILCPNKNGALKKTPSDRWAHVSCSLWVVSQIHNDHKDS